MSRSYTRSLTALLCLLSAATPSDAQDRLSAADSSRHAARRQRAFARLGNDVLIVRSKWAPSQFTQPSFEQGSTFYYFTGADRLLGAILGTSNTSGRVLGVTQVTQRRNTVKVRGVASTGRMAYNQYGMGYYGTLGANYQPDLSFSCDVDYRGYVRDVDINRR